MCIGIPMKVVELAPGRALVEGRGEQRWVDTALIGEPQPGEWLLIFLDGARERLDEVRAMEVNATLDLMAASLGADNGCHPLDAAAFTLPSQMSAEQLAALTGGR
jgi:hydrogenase expression/formation protein HypC